RTHLSRAVLLERRAISAYGGYRDQQLHLARRGGGGGSLHGRVSDSRAIQHEPEQLALRRRRDLDAQQQRPAAVALDYQPPPRTRIVWPIGPVSLFWSAPR